MGPDIRDAGEPRLVRTACAEIAPRRVGGRFALGGALLPLGVLGAAPGRAAPAVLPHYPDHALSRDAPAVALQGLENLRRAVGATAGLANFKHLRRELCVTERALGGGRPAVRAVPPPGDLQHRARLRHRALAAERRDELGLGLLTWPSSQSPAREEGAGF